MKIDCISDLHGYHPHLDGGDLLIVAGDMTGQDTPYERKRFSQWLRKQDYKKKIVIAGNHDGYFEAHPPKGFPFADILEDGTEYPFADYLCDSGCEYGGYHIWGSPYTPTFYNWAFMRERGSEIKQHWDLIPKKTDILVTHGPPFGILDKAYRSGGTFEKAGCEMLLDAVTRIKPLLHVFGHIHEGYGQYEEIWGDPELSATLFVNASIQDRRYNPVNKPILVELK